MRLSLLIAPLILISVCLMMVPVVHADLSGYGYSYSKSFTITGSSDGAATDHTFPIRLHSGTGSDTVTDIYLNNHCTNFPADIRFTDIYGNPRNYYVQTVLSETGGYKALVFVKVPYIGQSASLTYLVHYGKTGATSASSISSTFKWGDDFTYNYLDADTWTIRGDPSYDFSNGILHYTQNAANQAIESAVEVNSADTWRICALVKDTGRTPALGFGHYDYPLTSGSKFVGRATWTVNQVYLTAQAGTSQTSSSEWSGSTSDYVRVDIFVSGTTSLYENGVLKGTVTGVPSASMPVTIGSNYWVATLESYIDYIYLDYDSDNPSVTAVSSEVNTQPHYLYQIAAGDMSYGGYGGPWNYILKFANGSTFDAGVIQILDGGTHIIDMGSSPPDETYNLTVYKTGYYNASHNINLSDFELTTDGNYRTTVSYDMYTTSPTIWPTNHYDIKVTITGESGDNSGFFVEAASPYPYNHAYSSGGIYMGSTWIIPLRDFTPALTGEYNLSVSKPGYTTQYTTVTLPSSFTYNSSSGDYEYAVSFTMSHNAGYPTITAVPTTPAYTPLTYAQKKAINDECLDLWNGLLPIIAILTGIVVIGSVVSRISK